MVCLDERDEALSRFYCISCGKPLCAECADRCLPDYRVGKGCPSCRSTQDVVFVTANVLEMDRVTLRLNGTHENFSVSGGALLGFNEKWRSIVLANPIQIQNEPGAGVRKKVLSDLSTIAIEAITAFIKNDARALAFTQQSKHAPVFAIKML